MNPLTCLVTGANSGIGKATAAGLARQGATVIMVCRNQEKADQARTEIINQSGNDDIHIRIADLASQASISDLAASIKQDFGTLNVLVNNAALLLGKRTFTGDGIETTFAVNHLAYFQLAIELLDLLRANTPSRIVNVSSEAHRSGNIHFDDVSLEKGYSSYRSYAQSKLANILFTYELDRRLKGEDIAVNALHPGVVSTRIGSHGFSLFGLLFNLARPFFMSPKRGAATSLHVATSEEAAAIRGRYFVKKKPVSSAPQTYDTGLAEQLWQYSETLTSLTGRLD